MHRIAVVGLPVVLLGAITNPFVVLLAAAGTALCIVLVQANSHSTRR